MTIRAPDGAKNTKANTKTNTNTKANTWTTGRPTIMLYVFGKEMTIGSDCKECAVYENYAEIAKYAEIVEYADYAKIAGYAECAEYADYTNYAKYKENADFANYAKYKEYAEYAKHAKYAKRICKIFPSLFFISSPRWIRIVEG